MTITVEGLIKIIEHGGSTALILGLIYVIWALMTGKLVPGYLYTSLKADYNTLLQTALRGTALGEKIVDAITPTNNKES